MGFCCGVRQPVVLQHGEREGAVLGDRKRIWTGRAWDLFEQQRWDLSPRRAKLAGGSGTCACRSDMRAELEVRKGENNNQLVAGKHSREPKLVENHGGR